jgi:Flp pilus assembly protein TadB
VRLIRRRRDPRESVGNANLRDGLAHVARALRSSQTLSSALIASAARHPTDVTRDLARMVIAGTPVADACQRIIPVTSDRDVIMTLHVLALSASGGGDVAGTIDSLVATIDERDHARAERKVQAATATASTRLITWLPVVCGGYMFVEHPDVRRTMFATPLGWTCLVIGITLNLVGRRWTRALIEGS